MKPPFTFSLRVVLTTGVLAPIVYQIFLLLADPIVNEISSISISALFYTIIVGTILLVPVWFLIGIVTKVLLQKKVSIYLIKTCLSLILIPALILPIGLLNIQYLTNVNYWPSILPLLISYYICLTSFIWIYGPPLFI